MVKIIVISTLFWAMLTQLGVSLTDSGLLPHAIGPWIGYPILLCGWYGLFRRQDSNVINFRHRNEEIAGLSS